jgi:hypothetical protein
MASASVLPRVPQGTQFITGPCTSDADCGSGCCGFNTGKCAGAVVAQERDGGCGFGNATPNNDAAIKVAGPCAPAAPGVPEAGAAAASTAPAASTTTAATSPAKAPGTQFITGPCTSDADCGSGCCGFNTGKCAGAIVAQERDGGCGFGNTTPNNDAAIKIAGPNAAAAPGVPKAGAATAAAPAAPAPATTTAASTPAKAPGTQFITGACTSDADCASGCCGFKTGKCAGAVIAQERDGGCGFGNATPNNDAAQKIQGPNAEKAAGVPRSLA